MFCPAFETIASYNVSLFSDTVSEMFSAVGSSTSTSFVSVTTLTIASNPDISRKRVYLRRVSHGLLGAETSTDVSIEEELASTTLATPSFSPSRVPL